MESDKVEPVQKQKTKKVKIAAQDLVGSAERTDRTEAPQFPSDEVEHRKRQHGTILFPTSACWRCSVRHTNS